MTATPLVVSPPSMRGATLAFTSGGISSGRRWIAASILDTPGRVAACRYHSLWVDAKEIAPFDGEPWVHATRRPTDDRAWTRESLTDNAAKLLRAEVGAAIARHGFDQAWRAVFRDRNSGDGRSNARRLRELAAWWDRATDAAQLIDAVPDRVTYRPIPRDASGRQPQQLRPSRSSGRGDCEWAYLDVEVRVDGEPVGYLDPDGALLPTEGLPR